MRLLDTDIMVDLRRGYRPAVEWMNSLGEAPGVPGFVVMELAEGCRDYREMGELMRSLATFRVYWPTDSDANRAVLTFCQSHLSEGIGILDAIIGECAVGLGATLCTFNVKHFRAVSNLLTEQPYARA